MKRDMPITDGWTVIARASDGWMADSRSGLRIVASYGGGWDHVSVSRKDRTPTWEEMTAIKDLLFDPEDCVFQYHPPKSKYVNHHPHCLHLWRSQRERMPMPPMSRV